MYDLPSYVWVLVLVGVIGIPATTCLMLYRGARSAGLDRQMSLAVAGSAAVLLGAWLTATAVLARAGAYEQRAGEFNPWIGVAFAGVLVLLLAASRLPVLRRVLAAPDTAARLALPHTLRVVGAAFVVVMALGSLPALFALPAGLGDIAIGVSAPFVARRLARGAGHERAVWFNVLGIVDLVVAVGLGLLIGVGVLDAQPSTRALGLLPLALVPTVAVPLAIALHLVSLGRLATAARSGRSRARGLAGSARLD